MANKNQEHDHDGLSWGLIIFLFIIGLEPIALILLFVKLFGSDTKKVQASGSGRPAQEGQSSKAAAAVKKVTKKPKAKKSTANWLRIIGLVLVAAGLIACGDPIGMMIQRGSAEGRYLSELMTAATIAIGGGAMFISGLTMDRALKRYARYLAVMGDRDAVSLEELSRTLGHSRRQVEKDLQRMIEKGYFGGKAYLHMEQGYLFRSGDALAAMMRRKEEESLDGYEKILRDIHRTNERIHDPALSEKVDRIEAVAAKIFQAVEADPKKEARIGTFLSYYIPTTQKLLDSYAAFEDAGVEGENLYQAKQRIEATMDKIILGFERQLDELYQVDVMDVHSDIQVMETMLRRDTATVEDDFGLSGMEY